MTVQSRPSAKETWAQILSLVCPRERRASRSVPDLTSAGDPSFLQKHHAISVLGFSPPFLSHLTHRFLPLQRCPKSFPRADPDNSDCWQSRQWLIPDLPPLPSGAAYGQKTNDLRGNNLHQRHRREDHGVSDIGTLGRRHLGRVDQNSWISCCT